MEVNKNILDPKDENLNPKNNLITSIVSYFLKGLAIIVPIALSIYAVVYLVLTIDTFLPWFNTISPGIGFAIVVIFIALVGWIGDRFLITRWIFSLFDYFLERIPGVKFIYSGTKDIMSSFVGDKKKFTNPVWVLVNEQPQMYRIGFLTQESVAISNDSQNLIAVYLPHSYAISGWVILIERTKTIPVQNMNSAEAMKFAVSGGVAGINEVNSSSAQVVPNQSKKF